MKKGPFSLASKSHLDNFHLLLLYLLRSAASIKDIQKTSNIKKNTKILNSKEQFLGKSGHYTVFSDQFQIKVRKNKKKFMVEIGFRMVLKKVRQKLKTLRKTQFL